MPKYLIYIKNIVEDEKIFNELKNRIKDLFNKEDEFKILNINKLKKIK